MLYIMKIMFEIEKKNFTNKWEWKKKKNNCNYNLDILGRIDGGELRNCLQSLCVIRFWALM